MNDMERKIGEIFEYNGEWYQCIVGNSCVDCSFNKRKCSTVVDNGDPIGDCCADRRKDNKSVIFKKLEKVGEPYEFDGHLFQSYHTFAVPIFTENYATVRELGNNSKISIEIKQNKEDMEEKKLNLKPFDIQKAREGKPVCTRDGRKARIICFDAKRMHQPIIALITQYNGVEYIETYYSNGCFNDDINSQSDYDLMMFPEKKEGWINIYDADTTFRYVDGRVYETKDEAVQKAKEEIAKELRGKNEYIDTIRVEWEE